VSASFGSPVYGWVPLGWGEPLTPWWRRCSYNCWAAYNRPYAVNIAVRPSAPPAQFRNVVVPGGVSAVAGTTLNGRLMVREHLVPVASQQMRAAPVLAAAPQVPASSPHLGTRAGTGGTPQPASAYYPVSRQGRTNVEAGTRQPTAPPAAATPAPTRAVTRPPTTAAPAPGVDPTGTTRSRTPAPGSPYPAATTNATQPPTTTRTRPSQPVATPENAAPGTVVPTPTARGDATRQRSVPQGSTTTPPGPPQSISRETGSRATTVPPGAAPGTVAPGPHGAPQPQGAQGGPGVQREGHAEHQQNRSVEKGERKASEGQGAPAKQ
jgi:hypothetical protein